MTIPKYDEMYRAFLDCLTDGQPHKSKEVKDTIAEVFHLSDEERAVLLPSGSGPVFDGRVGWTRTYLKKVGLIQSPSRGVFALTPAGKQVLSENPNAKTAAGDGIFSRSWLQMLSARIILFLNKMISSFYSAVSRQTAWAAVRNVLTSFFSGSGRWPQSCGLIKRF